MPCPQSKERGVGPALLGARQSPGKTPLWGTSLLCTKHQPNQKGDSGRSWPKTKTPRAVQVYSFKVSLDTVFVLFCFFSFIRSDQIKMVRPLRPIFCPTSAPSQQLAEWIMCLLGWGDHFTAFPASLRERKLCFCHWFSHIKLISPPFAGSEAAVSKSAISLCFVSVSAGEILNSFCTKLLKFYIILKLCFSGLGDPGQPFWLWEHSTVWAGSVLVFPSSFPHPVPTLGEVSVRSVRCTSCSLLA